MEHIPQLLNNTNNLVLFAQNPKPFLGTWNGTLSAMGMEFTIGVELSLDDDGNIQGTIDVIEQGAEDLPLGEFELEGNKISFKIVHPDVPGDSTFTGELYEGGKTIAGTFSRMGMEGEFTLKMEEQ